MNKKLALRLAAIPAFVAASAGSAMAALPADATTAIETAGADLVSTAGLILTAMVGFWGVKKLGTKMGWW